VVDGQVQQYIKSQLASGFSIAQIKQALRASGYGEDVISNAFPKRHHTLLLIIVLFLVLSAVTVALVFLFQTDDVVTRSTADITLSVYVDDTGRSGEPLYFTLNLDVDEPFIQGRVVYTLFNEEGEEVGLKQEVLPDQETIRDSIVLPHTLPLGTYSLHARVRVKDSTAAARTSFDITGKGSTFRLVGVPVEENKQSSTAEIEEIISLVDENAATALSLCEEFADRDVHDQCLLEGGLAVNDERFCAAIFGGNKRDTCYFNVYLSEKKPGLCQGIQNPHLRRTCQQL
jgi:hypothetical protein